MSEFECINYSVENGVAHIQLSRPDAANSFNVPLSRGLMHAASRASEDPNVRAVILSGEGKMFCAGGDVAAMAESKERVGEMLKEITTYLHTAISHLTRMNAPLIIAVNGTAAGAGFSLAAIGDMVLASDKAKFTMAYTGIGVSPDGSSSWFLPRLIGMRRTQELMLTNRLLSAEEACDWGVVNKVVAGDELLDEAQALASKLAAGPTLAHGRIKQLLASSFNESLETQMDMEARGIAAMVNCEDGKEGIGAFVEKRKPSFCGK